MSLDAAFARSGVRRRLAGHLQPRKTTKLVPGDPGTSAGQQLVEPGCQRGVGAVCWVWFDMFAERTDRRTKGRKTGTASNIIYHLDG